MIDNEDVSMERRQLLEAQYASYAKEWAQSYKEDHGQYPLESDVIQAFRSDIYPQLEEKDQQIFDDYEPYITEQLKQYTRMTEEERIGEEQRHIDMIFENDMSLIYRNLQAENEGREITLELVFEYLEKSDPKKFQLLKQNESYTQQKFTHLKFLLIQENTEDEKQKELIYQKLIESLSHDIKDRRWNNFNEWQAFSEEKWEEFSKNLSLQSSEELKKIFEEKINFLYEQYKADKSAEIKNQLIQKTLFSVLSTIPSDVSLKDEGDFENYFQKECHTLIENAPEEVRNVLSSFFQEKVQELYEEWKKRGREVNRKRRENREGVEQSLFPYFSLQHLKQVFLNNASEDDIKDYLLSKIEEAILGLTEKQKEKVRATFQIEVEDMCQQWVYNHATEKENSKEKKQIQQKAKTLLETFHLPKEFAKHFEQDLPFEQLQSDLDHLTKNAPHYKQKLERINVSEKKIEEKVSTLCQIGNSAESRAAEDVLQEKKSLAQKMIHNLSKWRGVNVYTPARYESDLQELWRALEEQEKAIEERKSQEKEVKEGSDFPYKDTEIQEEKKDIQSDSKAQKQKTLFPNTEESETHKLQNIKASPEQQKTSVEPDKKQESSQDREIPKEAQTKNTAIEELINPIQNVSEKFLEKIFQSNDFLHLPTKRQKHWRKEVNTWFENKQFTEEIAHASQEFIRLEVKYNIKSKSLQEEIESKLKTIPKEKQTSWKQKLSEYISHYESPQGITDYTFLAQAYTRQLRSLLDQIQNESQPLNTKVDTSISEIDTKDVYEESYEITLQMLLSDYKNILPKNQLKVIEEKMKTNTELTDDQKQSYITKYLIPFCEEEADFIQQNESRLIYIYLMLKNIPKADQAEIIQSLTTIEREYQNNLTQWEAPFLAKEKYEALIQIERQIEDKSIKVESPSEEEQDETKEVLEMQKEFSESDEENQEQEIQESLPAKEKNLDEGEESEELIERQRTQEEISATEKIHLRNKAISLEKNPEKDVSLDELGKDVIRLPELEEEITLEAEEYEKAQSITEEVDLEITEPPHQTSEEITKEKQNIDQEEEICETESVVLESLELQDKENPEELKLEEKSGIKKEFHIPEEPEETESEIKHIQRIIDIFLQEERKESSLESQKQGGKKQTFTHTSTKVDPKEIQKYIQSHPKFAAHIAKTFKESLFQNKIHPVTSWFYEKYEGNHITLKQFLQEFLHYTQLILGKDIGCTIEIEEDSQERILINPQSFFNILSKELHNHVNQLQSLKFVGQSTQKKTGAIICPIRVTFHTIKFSPTILFFPELDLYESDLL